MSYPNDFQVQCASQMQLARWLWLLPSASSAAETEIRAAIKSRFKGWTPFLMKAVDWTNRIK